MENRILSRNEIQNIYRKWAKAYNISTYLFYLLGFRIRSYRKKAIENLQLNKGDTVVDLGCGTGLNFELLQKQVGPNGQIIGVDLSGEMLKQAQKRINKQGWSNVELVHSDMADYHFDENTDGILSTLAITMSPDYDRIIERASRQLKPGKRISIFELQKPDSWPEWLIKTMVFLLRSYGTRYGHTRRKPGKSINTYFQKSSCQEYYFGAICIAYGEGDALERY